jgi:hypothetical protein
LRTFTLALFQEERGRGCALGAVLLGALWLAGVASAQDSPLEQNAVEEGKRILSSGSKFPWYDRRQDDVRPLNAVPRGRPDERGDTSWTKTPSAAGRGGTGQLNLFGTALQWAGISVLIVLLGLIAFLIAKAFLKDEVSDHVVHRKVIESSRDVDRVEALPFHLRKATGDFLGEARRLYEAGEFSEAIIYLFSYQLVQLDRQHLIRLAKGKTNRQYLRELRQRPALRGILETTVVNFEDAFFGRKRLSREQFERSWQQLDDFHGQIAQLERAAA